MKQAVFFLAVYFFSSALHAQSEETRTLDIEGGAHVAYVLRSHPADAHLLQPSAVLEPTSALNAAKLLNLHLSTGDIEEAALLSNAPRRRFEMLQDYRQSVGEDEFKRVFAQYFDRGNRLIAEIAIDKHRLLIWDLREGATGRESPESAPSQEVPSREGKGWRSDRR